MRVCPESGSPAGFPASPARLPPSLSHPHLAAGPNFILAEASICAPLPCARDECLLVTSSSLPGEWVRNPPPLPALLPSVLVERRRTVACPAMLLPRLVLSRPEPMVDGTSSYWLTEPTVQSFNKLPTSYQTICSLRLGPVTVFTLWTSGNATTWTPSTGNLLTFTSCWSSSHLAVCHFVLTWLSPFRAPSGSSTLFSLQAGWHNTPSVPRDSSIQQTLAGYPCVRACPGCLGLWQ